MYKNLKLGTKLIAILLLVSLIPFIGISIFSYQRAESEIRYLIYSEMDLYTDAKEDIIEVGMHEEEAAVQLSAVTRDIYQSLNILNSAGGNRQAPEWLERERTILDIYTQAWLNEYDTELINMTDSNGVIVYSTDRSLIGTSLAQEGYIREALGGNATTAEFFFSDSLNEYCTAVVAPIYSQGNRGNVIGTLSAVIPLRYIEEIVLNGLEIIGETGDAYLVDANGRLLTRPKFGNLEPFRNTISTQAARDLVPHISSRNAAYEQRGTYNDYVGNRVLGEYSVVMLGDIPVGLIVEIDYAEAYNAIFTLRNTMITVCVIVLIAIILIGWRFSKSITDPINNITTNISSSSEQVSAASEQLSSSSQQIAEANAEQASSIQETSSTLEESSSMVQQNTENTKQAANLSEQAKVAADKGNNEMVEMMNSMNEIKKSSDEIAKIIKVIDEIAFQTNILALNAAVEAARAGDAGMGFAVVAEEVRNLAQRSAQAAKDTAEIIENNITMSGKGVDVARRVGESLSEINAQSKKVNELMDEIYASSQEQAQGITQINKAIIQMEKATQENASTAEETASASEELNAQALNLEEMVHQLRGLIEGASSKNNYSNSGNYKRNKSNKKNSFTNNTKKYISSNNNLSSKKTHIIDPDDVIHLDNESDDF